MSVRLEFWRKHIEAKEASGLSVEQYCRDHHLTTSQYYNWRAKVRSLDAEPKFVRVAGEYRRNKPRFFRRYPQIFAVLTTFYTTGY